MNRYISNFVIPIIILSVSIFKSIYAQNNDSISYYTIRNNYIEIFGDNKYYREYIEVSDGLASAKLFREAEDILTDLFREDQHSLLLDTNSVFNYEGIDEQKPSSSSLINNSETTLMTGQPYDPVSWRITSSGSYKKYQYQDEESDDTILNILDSMTNNTSDSKISNEYLSGYFSLTSDWIPKSNYIKKISPYFYISDYYGKLGSKMELSFFNHHMKVDGEIQGKLPMDKQYRDSSTAIMAEIETEFKSPSLIKNSTTNSINLQLDLNFSFTQNRKDRRIDISNRLYTINPTIEWSTADYMKNSSIGFLYKYKDYNRYVSTSVDSTEVVREDDRYNLGPFIDADFWNDIISTSVYWSLLWEFYLKRNDSIPSYSTTSNRNAFFEIMTTFTPVNNFEFYLTFNYDMTFEHFPCYEIAVIDTDLLDSNYYDTISFESKTHYFRIEPELYIYYRVGIGNSIKFLYERQTTAIHSGPQYMKIEKIEDDYFSFLIGTSFYTNVKAFYFETSFNYTKKNIIEKTEFSFSDGDSFTLEPAVSIKWSPLEWLSFNLNGEFEYLKYLESINPEYNTNISLGCRLNF